MRLQALTRRDLIFPRLPGTEPHAVLQALADRVTAAGVVDDAAHLYKKLWEREELGSTAMGSGIAIPHCKLKAIPRVVLAVGVSEDGADFGAPDDEPVRLFFLMVSPADAPADHLRSLAALSRWLKGDDHVPRLLGAGSAEEIYEILGEGDA